MTENKQINNTYIKLTKKRIDEIYRLIPKQKPIKSFDITANEKPKWYNFRWKISNMLVNVARKIYPENPDVMAFFAKLFVDASIYNFKDEDDG